MTMIFPLPTLLKNSVVNLNYEGVSIDIKMILISCSVGILSHHENFIVYYSYQ